MFVLKRKKDKNEEILIESQDYMDIVEFIISTKQRKNLNIKYEKDIRRMFFNLNTKKRHTLSDNSTLHLKEVLF